MKRGILYGIGVGPGDPELITLKAAKILGQARHVFAPMSEESSRGAALQIAQRYMSADAMIHELAPAMVSDEDQLRRHWKRNAQIVAEALGPGEDGCFVTLGDTLLYSTFIHLIRELKEIAPDIPIITAPGVTAFSASAAVSESPMGEGTAAVRIIPSSDDPQSLRQALEKDGAVVIMKVGKRLNRIIDELESAGRIKDAVFVSRAGRADQRVEIDLSKLRKESPSAGGLSTILVRHRELKD
jgi:precorrin-2/cobalt-factor-2 C20-methyltransferase